VIMHYVADTNVISEYMKPQPNENVIKWLQANKAQTTITSITVGELFYGAQSLSAGKRKEALLQAIEDICIILADNILAYDARAAKEFAKLRALAKQSGHTPCVEDLMIAAVCVSNKVTLVTRNVRDFSYLGLQVLNPF